jgi:hypothetical protein
LICGRQQITREDLWPVIELTFDSTPSHRAKVFRLLIENGGELTTDDVVKALRCSAPTARKEMEALHILEVVEKAEGIGHSETHIWLAEMFAWFKSDECRELIGVLNSGNLLKENPACVPGSEVRKTNHTPVVSVSDSSISGYSTQGGKPFSNICLLLVMTPASRSKPDGASATSSLFSHARGTVRQRPEAPHSPSSPRFPGWHTLVSTGDKAFYFRRAPRGHSRQAS